MKTFHLIMPSSLVTPLLLHMFHRTAVESDMKLWLYGSGDSASLLKQYKDLNQILNQHMEGEVIKNFCDIRHLEIPRRNAMPLPGFGDILGLAEQLVRSQLMSDTEPDDEVTIIADSNLWLGVTLAYKSLNVVRKAPRLISMASPEDPTEMANINFLIDEFHKNIRIDLIEKGRCTDILAVARAVEAIEPPDEPDGLYITRQKQSSFYISDEDLPTPITTISLRTLIQLRANIEYCKTSDKFLKRIKVQERFRTFNQVRQLETVLDMIKKYLEVRSTDFRCTYKADDMRSALEKIDKQPDGHSSEYYCEKALKHILYVSFERMDKIGEGMGAEVFEIPKIKECDIDFSECLNPFLCAGVTLKAFNSASEDGLALRSCCLDIWEWFMNPSDIGGMDVSELVVKDNEENWTVYRTLPYSEAFFSQKAIYKILKDGECIAVTSPLTGFACGKGCSAFTKLELSERSERFKKFIYDYVMSVPGFAQEFKEYVTNNCVTKELGLDSRGFFEKYPEFGKKIPLY